MGWRYDVFECTHQTTQHHFCEISACRSAGVFWNGRWKDAYRKAETLTHAMVTAQYTGELAYSKSPRTVFEHIEGGGPCDFCPEGRGPMCQTIDTNEFICDPCRSTLRQGSEQLSRRLGVEPSRFLYVPIIETVEYEV